MKIKIRRDTTAAWASANPVLASGELGAEIQVSGLVKLKMGNGITAWNALPYATGGEKGDKGDTGNTGNTGATGAQGIPFDLVNTSVDINSDAPTSVSQGEPSSTIYFFKGHGTAKTIDIQSGCSFTSFTGKPPGDEPAPGGNIFVSNLLIKNSKPVSITINLVTTNFMVDYSNEVILVPYEWILFSIVTWPTAVFNSKRTLLSVVGRGGA